MTSKEWVEKVQKNAPVLVDLVVRYHPGSNRASVLDNDPDVSITAPVAEIMCNNLRQEIRKNTFTSPVQDFMNAITLEDSEKIYSIFSKTWLGVPESTSCWSIPGFSLMVDLMDDHPEDWNSQEENDPQEEASIEAFFE